MLENLIGTLAKSHISASLQVSKNMLVYSRIFLHNKVYANEHCATLGAARLSVTYAMQVLYSEYICNMNTLLILCFYYHVEHFEF